MSLSDRWRAFIDSQHRLPSGLVGQLVGERMVRQHAPETAWTLELLAIRPENRVLELGFGAGLRWPWRRGGRSRELCSASTARPRWSAAPPPATAQHFGLAAWG